MHDQRPVVPFLKWAGGKRWLIRNHSVFFDIPNRCRYVEPFLGSGAVFFSLLPKQAMLNDLNRELITTYTAIRDEWKMVARALADHNRKHSHEYYYHIRGSIPKDSVALAARFIYLNRTCFNGIYRVNRRGEFNVPLGTKTSVVLDTDDFEGVASSLSEVVLRSDDFQLVIDDCGRGDFIFADPPYTVKHNNNGFVKYNERLFSWSDQERLSASLRRAAKRGASVVVSNADHSSIRDLYSGCDILTLSRHSVMASEAARRRITSEILVRL